MSFILGKKLRMSQIWNDGTVIPVTIIEAQPNRVSLVREKARDHYEAVQLNLGKTKREFRARKNGAISFKKDDVVSVDTFKEGDLVTVSSATRGRGFQGVVKRYNFRGGPATHGQKNRQRAPGSIGSTAPQRVWPGRRMAGHMGTNRVTVKNLKVVGIDKEKHHLLIRGAVPGTPGTLVEIRTVS